MALLKAMKAIAADDEAAMIAICASHPMVGVEGCSKYGKTLLHLAASIGKEKMAILLLARFHVSVLQTDIHGLTALHYAAMCAKPELVALLAPITNRSLKTNGGMTALELAYSFKNRIAVPQDDLPNFARIICMLEDGFPGDRGARNNPDGALMRAKHFMELQGNRKGLNALCESHPYIVNDEDPSNDASTLLHYASAACKVEMVKILLSKKAPINKANIYGWTALHFCCFFGKVDVCLYLLEAGADRDLRDLDGLTALELTYDRLGRSCHAIDMLERWSEIICIMERLFPLDVPARKCFKCSLASFKPSVDVSGDLSRLRSTKMSKTIPVLVKGSLQSFSKPSGITTSMSPNITATLCRSAPMPALVIGKVPLRPPSIAMAPLKSLVKPNRPQAVKGKQDGWLIRLSDFVLLLLDQLFVHASVTTLT